MDAPMPKKLFHLLVVNLTLTEIVLSGKVLIWPMNGSHWLNINHFRRVESKTSQRDCTGFISGALQLPSLFSHEFWGGTCFFQEEHYRFLSWTYDNGVDGLQPNPPHLLGFLQRTGKNPRFFFQINIQICDGVLSNPALMMRLQKGGFDVLLADPVIIFCGDLVALKLGIPFVYTLRFSPVSTVERHCGKIPSPVSYVPAALSGLNDQMTFGERVKNTLSYPLQDYIFQSYWGEWNSYYSKILDKSLKHPLTRDSRYLLYPYC